MDRCESEYEQSLDRSDENRVRAGDRGKKSYKAGSRTRRVYGRCYFVIPQ